MMKQAQKMQKDMASTQAALAERTVEATAGGGKVKVTATAAGDGILRSHFNCDRVVLVKRGSPRSRYRIKGSIHRKGIGSRE